MVRLLERDETMPHSPSVDPDEVDKFRRIAGEWWSPTGKFAPLH